MWMGLVRLIGSGSSLERSDLEESDQVWNQSIDLQTGEATKQQKNGAIEVIFMKIKYFQIGEISQFARNGTKKSFSLKTTVCKLEPERPRNEGICCGARPKHR